MIPKEIQENINDKSIKNFLKGFHSESTKESYCKKLVQFLEFHKNMTADKLIQLAKKNPKKVQHMIIDYVEEKKSFTSGSTLQQTRAALKHFFEMNDIEEGINWSKISKIIPHAKKTGSDRAPTVEEIRLMLKAADTRTRCVILVCCSSGIRVGAFGGMTWGDLSPIYKKNNDGEKTITTAKLTVYGGEREEYITFVTPECYDALEQYKRSRELIGERVTSKSPLIRDSWDNHKYRKDKRKEPALAKPLAPKTIANMMGEFLKKINLREVNSGTHEFKQIHGFRKFFKTNAERACKTIDVEKLMGHAENYYKPSLDYLLSEYVKTIPYLTISETVELKDKLKQQVTISDKKVGEIERDNVSLQDRLHKLESSYGSLKEILEDVLLARAKSK
ncbi:MAG: site-specific integrase [Nitrosopumilus sp.]|nr:site-specific integrase [Nitrosopumilus sp.]MDH5665952.1 site-specific integrase [Nitrosopumilus sp.]